MFEKRCIIVTTLQWLQRFFIKKKRESKEISEDEACLVLVL